VEAALPSSATILDESSHTVRSQCDALMPGDSARWPLRYQDLVRLQECLAASSPLAWTPSNGAIAIGGVWFVGPTGSAGVHPGEPAWAAAVALGSRSIDAVVAGRTPAGYRAGALAMREGPLLEAAVRALPHLPDVLLVNATGRDHPRRAGLALHVGAAVDVPTVGVTHRPLLAVGPEPPAGTGTVSSLELDGVVVAAWLRTRAGTRPILVHPAWRTDLETALEVVRRSVLGARTPEPLRRARRAARLARARGSVTSPVRPPHDAA
jgi:deoxyribonuclease V